LEKINAKEFSAREGSRDSVFNEVDRPCLKRLPSERFAYEEWQKVKVHLDHHIQVQYNYYSVPWKLVGMTLLARLTGRTVELFHNERRVASHARFYGRGKWSTCEEHMPPSHESCLKMTPEKIMQWALETGEKTALLAQEILGRKDHPQQGYRAIIGIMGFGKKYGIERLDAACGVALRLNALRFRDVKHILEAGLEAGVTDGREEEEPIMHENIRGADYYRGGEEC
jgi:transposase